MQSIFVQLCPPERARVRRCDSVSDEHINCDNYDDYALLITPLARDLHSAFIASILIDIITCVSNFNAHISIIIFNFTLLNRKRS